MNYKVVLLISCIIFGSAKVNGGSFDSLRMETREGKKFVIHQIEQGETLYQLSRRYQTSVSEIINYNKDLTTDIKIGQELVIPYLTIETNPSPTVTDLNPSSKIHIVDIGESVYAISKKYNITIKELQQWNQLSSFDINVGQELLIQAPEALIVSSDTSEPLLTAPKQSEDRKEAAIGPTKDFHIVQMKETLFGISKRYNISIDELKRLNGLKGSSLDLGQRLIISDAVEVKKVAESVDTLKTQPAPPPSLRFKEMGRKKDRIVEIGGIKKKYEEGFGAMIEGDLDTDKYLVLHKSAPFGTIIQIRNLMTKKTVTARVVGKLPATGGNENILIRLSKITFERLGGIDRNIPVEVSYIP